MYISREEKQRLLAAFNGTKYPNKLNEMELRKLNNGKYERITWVTVMKPYSIINGSKRIWKQLDKKQNKIVKRTISETMTKNMKNKNIPINKSLDNYKLLNKGFNEELKGNKGAWLLDKSHINNVKELMDITKEMDTRIGNKLVKYFMNSKNGIGVKPYRRNINEVKSSRSVFSQNRTEENHHLSMLHHIPKGKSTNIVKNTKHVRTYDFEMKFKNFNMENIDKILVTIDADPEVAYTKLGMFTLD